ncbi:MAG TPA: hypothetical protein VLR88_10960 [Propionibacteriaceae bacterium]|nr:hypothetical protein [Propionibacteriaceae bacterium]
MSVPPDRRAPAGYTLRIAGRLDARWSPWFGGLTVTSEGDGITTLSGPVTDQAHLHGLLTKIRDLGLTLVSVEAIDARGAGDPDPAPAIQEAGLE